MVEVEASLPKGSVYLAGEEVVCTIVFNCIKGSDASPVTLAWSSAQLLCQCNVAESRVQLKQPEEKVATSSNDTSFLPAKGEQGMTVLSTTPKILLCNIVLKPGEGHQVIYRDKLPQDGPPSFKGQCARYSYKVAVGVQRLGGTTKLLRVPLRVLVVYGLGEARAQLESEVTAPSNPFTEPDPAASSMRDLAAIVLQENISRRLHGNYQVKTSSGRVGRLCLHRPAVRLGEDLTGILDLTDADLACIQFTVSLVSEETVTEPFKRKANQHPISTCHSSQQVYCLGMQRADFAVPVPLHTTPDFATDIVLFRWKLHFEFTVSSQTMPLPSDPQDSADELSWSAPCSLSADSLAWDLSVRVLSALPDQVSSAAFTRTQATITL